jgi:protein Tex
LKELEKPGRDPRAQIEEFQFDSAIKTIEDVKPGMTVPGIVTNITNFGAFVDIGVKQDGLVHVSQLANKYVSDPNEVVKLNQKVIVTVTEVDVTRKRIALTMKGEGNQKSEIRSQKSEVGSQKPEKKVFNKKSETLNPFQSKLMELKKKFND